MKFSFLLNWLLYAGWLLLSVLGDVDSQTKLALSGAKEARQGRMSDHWVIKVDSKDMEFVSKLAQEHNFKLVRQVGSLEGYYVIESTHHKMKRSANMSLNLLIDKSVQILNAHPLVESLHKEEIKVRRKRDFIELPIQPNLFHINPHLFNRRHLLKMRLIDQQKSVEGIDPYWNEMWYINRHMSDPKMPDMNVTGAWAQGYSGRGVSVTFLDDGLEWNHPDIFQNYDPKASADLNDNDDDPMPRYDLSNENKHGTRCAGEVAAVANNSICSVGIAFNAGVGGIRMLDGDVTDSVEGGALSFNSQHVDIYSASWGPDDNGEVVDGPGALARRAFMDGINKGRKGLGSIFVWASGNGGRFNDSCACDGYANSIYTLSISSTSEKGQRPWFLEECASTLATTYSSGDEKNGEKEIVTTDIRHKCTTKHTGTSAAAPIAAGIIALTLEANPKLTWRDVMYVTVLTSRADAIPSNNYVVNSRGFKVSPRYGFGLMDAGRMVEVAKDWVNVEEMISCPTFNAHFDVETVQKSKSVEATLKTDACANTLNEVNFIEQVEIIVTIRAPVRGLLEIYLTSPQGTRSQILPLRSRDMSADGFKRWPFMSVHYWGESPKGNWKMSITSADGTLVQVDDYQLVIHGTKNKPVDYEKYINRYADTKNNLALLVEHGFEKKPDIEAFEVANRKRDDMSMKLKFENIVNILTKKLRKKF